MHRLRAAGVVGITLVVAACTASPTTTSTTAPVADAHTPASTAVSGDIATSADDDAVDVEGKAQVPMDGSADVDRGNVSGTAGEEAATGSDSEDSSSEQDSTSTAQADAGTTTTTAGVNSTAELGGLVDEVTELLADLDGILTDLDADLAGVQDGLNQNEGDI